MNYFQRFILKVVSILAYFFEDVSKFEFVLKSKNVFIY